MKKEFGFVAKLKKSFFKKKNFTRFVKGKLFFSNKGIFEFQAFKGQESFRIKPFIKSNCWAVFKSGKSFFKKGENIKCFSLSGLNEIFFK